MIEISIRNGREDILSVGDILAISKELLFPLRIDGERFFNEDDLEVPMDEILELQLGLVGRSGTGFTLEYIHHEDTYSIVVYEFAAINDYTSAISFAKDLYYHLKAKYFQVNDKRMGIRELERTDIPSLVLEDMEIAAGLDDYIVIDGIRHNIVIHSDRMKKFLERDNPEELYSDFLISHQMVNALTPTIFGGRQRDEDGIRHLDLMIPTGRRIIIPRNLEMMELMDGEFSDMNNTFNSLLEDLDEDSLENPDEIFGELDSRIKILMERAKFEKINPSDSRNTEYSVHIFEPDSVDLNDENFFSNENFNIVKFSEKVKDKVKKMSFDDFTRNLLKKNYTLLDDGQLIVDNFTSQDAEKMMKKITGRIKAAEPTRELEKGKILSFSKMKKGRS